MPKLQQTERQKADCMVRACIVGNMALYSKEHKQVARVAGMSLSTYYRRLEEPNTFTLEELRRIGKFLDFTPVQYAGIMFGRPLTRSEVKEFILM